MATEAQKTASYKYDKNNTKRISLKFNLATDADILKKLEEEKNVQGYIKKLIRSDILKQSTPTEFEVDSFTNQIG